MLNVLLRGDDRLALQVEIFSFDCGVTIYELLEICWEIVMLLVHQVEELNHLEQEESIALISDRRIQEDVAQQK